MDSNDNIMNRPEIRDILSELKVDVHLPFELILADVEGKLSSDGHSKVVSHLGICDECSSLFKQVVDFLGHTKESDEESGTASNISINPVLKQRLELTVTLNSKRDEIAKEIAQLLLPEDMWFSIKPSIVVYRNWLKSATGKEASESEQLPVAAFSGGSPQDTELFAIVINSVRFSDCVCDLLLERCDRLDEVERKLPEFVNDAIAVFDNITGQTKKEILTSIKDVVLTTNPQ